MEFLLLGFFTGLSLILAIGAQNIFVIGYLSKLLSKYLQSDLIWKRINLFIITFMSIIALYVLIEIIKFF